MGGEISGADFKLATGLFKGFEASCTKLENIIQYFSYKSVIYVEFKKVIATCVKNVMSFITLGQSQ